MRVKNSMSLKSTAALSVFLAVASFANGQERRTDELQSIPLTVPAGVPLRLYLTKRVPKRTNAPVEAKLLTTLFAFDHEVIPAGTQVLGHVSRLEPVPRWERIRAVLGGDFTPLHIAQIEFTSLVLPNGGAMELHTVESAGLSTLVPLKPPKQRSRSTPADATGTFSKAKQEARNQIGAKVDRIRGIPDLVRGTDKKEWLYDYAMSRLPYHPQSVRNRTRFDAELKDPLQLGSETVSETSLALLGSQPAPGSIVHARLLTPLNSVSSLQGEKIYAVLDQPLFSGDHRLILPEGTRVSGSVAMVKRAGWLHRPGRLRFSFQSIDLPPQVADLKLPPEGPATTQEPAPPPRRELQFRTQATLNAAEGGNAPLKVDKEGGVQASESKTRFFGLAAALLVSRAAGDSDAARSHGGVVTGQSSNIAGRTLGGGLGFGLLGSIAAQSSRNVGAAFGYYGLGWTFYSTVIARGTEVEFDKNAVIDIGFNNRAAVNAGSQPNGRMTRVQ